MSAHLDDLHRQYCTMLRDGHSPTGLVMEYELFRRIGAVARRDDPRVAWGEAGPEKLFGFKPQFVLSAPPRFTVAPGEATRRATERAFTLRELRSL